MTKRKGDFRSKIDSILADDPEPASEPGGSSGLDRMFGAEGNSRQSDDALARHVAPTTETKLDEIDLKKIKLARGRRTDADRDLKDGIGKSGILQPLLLRPAGSGYEVLDGGRRLAVARELGLKTVPAVVRTIADAEARAMSAERKATPAAPARPERKPAATVARPVRGAGRGRKAAVVAAGAATRAAARPRAAAPIAVLPPAARRAAASARKSTAASAKATPPKALRAKATATKVTPARATTAKANTAKSTAAKAPAGRASAAKAAAAKAPAKTTASRASAAKATATTSAKAAAKPTAAQKSGAFAAAAARARADAAAKAAAKPATRTARTTAKGGAAGKPGPRRSAEKILPVEVPASVASVPEPKVVFGQADETVEMRRPSIAAAAEAAAETAVDSDTGIEAKTAEETMIWQRPKDDDRVPEKPAAIASTALTRKEEAVPAPSFPRQDDTPVARPIPASAVRSGSTTAAPSRGRSVIQTVFFMLALFALAFAATTLAVYGDVGLSLQAGLICVVALVLFAAVTLTGRRTGP
ncbi:MAG: ParB family transcriptional regulator, chromosome partitioning protein [Chloroflexota bacterium]|jgi:hypothetical protein|nr:ParB family transcriptional regulator, chromosome partitioning protein [Chloroflexota bacterium]